MWKRIILLIVIIALFGAATYYFYLQEKKPRKELILYGNVDVRQVDLGFQVIGRVIEMKFEEGDWVDPGVLMGRLDKQPYFDQVKEAEANVTAVQKNLENAKRIHKRRQELIDEGSVAREDLEQTTTNVEVYTANLEQAESALSVAKTNLAFTEVYAPTQGTILTRVREPGTVVSIGDPIYTLSVASPVWIRAFISEPDLGLIYPGMKAEVHTDTPNGKVYQGTIGFISPVAEFTPKTVETTQLRTDLVYRLRIYAENPDRSLRQGMPVTVHLPLETSREQH